MLNETVLLFFDAHQIHLYSPVEQYPSHHPDELSLHLKGIEYQITKVGYLKDKPIQNIQKDPKLIPRMYELKYAQTRHRLEAGIKL